MPLGRWALRVLAPASVSVLENEILLTQYFCGSYPFYMTVNFAELTHGHSQYLH